jgi:isocitrate dehydrogenase (NAD+)
MGATEPITAAVARGRTRTSSSSMIANTRIEATLIPGDGIGPEIVEAVRLVLDALGSPFLWDVRAAGMEAVAKFGDALPNDTLESTGALNWR